MVRMNRMLMGNDAGPNEQIEVAMLMAAISGAAIHPLCVDFDDDRLRSSTSASSEAVSGSAGLSHGTHHRSSVVGSPFCRSAKGWAICLSSSVFVRIPGQ